MLRFLQQIPVKLPILGPFPLLGKFLAHEQQLLARMPEHERIACLQVRKLIIIKSRHLVDHGALQMDDLIVGEYQAVLLRVRVGHRKGHPVVVELTEIRIQLHVLNEVMHPSHIPLHGESQAVILRNIRHLRPCGGFLGDHHDPGMLAAHHRIQVLKELDRLEVFISAILSRDPFPIPASVIEIENRSNSIHAQTVNMELLDPEQCISDQEVLYLALAKIENLRAPVRMLALARIRVFIASRSVEVRQPVGILRKMRRHPVQDDADSVPMQVVDHVREVLRRSKTAGRCIITGHLIAQ